MKKRGVLVGVGVFACLLVSAPVRAQDAAPVENAREALGRSAELAPARAFPRIVPRRGLDPVRRWNQIAIDASGVDHTPVAVGELRTFGEQLGPGRSARAMAIAHVAIFEVVNAIDGDYQSYVGIERTRGYVSRDAAVAQAAHDALAALFPSQSASFAAFLAEDLARARARDLRGVVPGRALGRRAARAILAKRAADGSAHPEPRMDEDFIPKLDAGWWRQDPISLVPIALGAHWGEVAPFTFTDPARFRLPPPPAMTSPEYTLAFDEVKSLGGDGESTPTVRSADQTEAGIYWAYDGTPSLCAPPRLYNQIAVLIANQRKTGVLELARLLALVNVAMADAGIASWESKFHYQLWRPIGGIREADAGTGPLGLGDGNPDTLGDPNWQPLGAPASNLQGPNFTPPFPAYPSGHATFGGTLFQVLRRFYGTDRIAFTFVSDELNGVTLDNQGDPRPLLPRTFQTLSQAEEENGQSRIYLGIHWAFDKTQGIAQGRQVGDHVFRNLYPRVRR